MDLVTLNFDLFDLETGKPVDQRWGTFIPNVDTLGLRVLEVICYVRDGRTADGQTDGRTDGQKQRLMSPSLPAGA